MKITVSNQITTDHDLIKRIVREGFEGVDSRFVEVHVKRRTPRTYWLVLCDDEEDCSLPINYRGGPESVILGAGHIFGGPRARAKMVAALHNTTVIPNHPHSNHCGVSGMAYNGIPSIANVGKRAKYLVTIKLPPEPDNAYYPYDHVHPSARSVTVHIPNWEADLFQTAAHEAKHIEQYKEGLSLSEVRCQRWSAHRLAKWLGER